jgi:predicted SAM-dependent methyltransferase
MAMLSARTRRGIRFDLMRLRARISSRLRRPNLRLTRLHLGCGSRRIDGWLNVDLIGSDFDCDLGSPFPLPSSHYEAAIAQQLVEHFELETDLPLFLQETHRVLRPGAVLWVSCPDMATACTAYAADRATSLVADRATRFPSFSLAGAPSQHFVNVLFHQGGAHRNLFDEELLSWLLVRAGFCEIERREEGALLEEFPAVPVRGDDAVALYVRALK